MKYLTAILLTALMLPLPALAGNKAGATSETLLDAFKSWDGKVLKSYPAGPPELTVLKITIPAHTKLAWHEHPMPNAAYIVSGTLTIEKHNGAKKIVHAGDAFAETVDTVHRGITGNTPVVLLAFYAGAKGVPVSVPWP